jgi:hypothetical protein
VAAWTRATIAGEAEIVVIIHDAPTFWNQVPMFEATLAIQSQRKMVWRSGLQGERASALATRAALRPWELIEIARGGGEEASCALDQSLDDFGIDRDLSLEIGYLLELKGVVEQAVKGRIQELRLGEVVTVLAVDLNVSREMKTARKE